MSVYYVKEIGNHGKRKCIQGMFAAKSHAELFWIIDQQHNPYQFMFTKVPNGEFGVWFEGLDHIAQEEHLDEDDYNFEELTDFSFDGDESPAIPLCDVKIIWKTWKNGTSGTEWVKTNAFGEY